MGMFAGWPWWAQLLGIIILVLLAVFVFREVLLPLLSKFT